MKASSALTLLGVFLAGGVAGMAVHRYVNLRQALALLQPGEEKAAASLSEDGFIPASGSGTLSGEWCPPAKIRLQKAKLAQIKRESLDTLQAELAEPPNPETETAARELIEQLKNARRSGTVATAEFQNHRVFRDLEVDAYSSRDAWANAEARLAAISGFAHYLESQDIHLIYCPVPSTLDTYLPVLLGLDPPRPAQRENAEFLARLLEMGVDVVDLRRVLIGEVLSGKAPYHSFDHHWTPTAIEKAAGVLAAEIEKRYEIQQPKREEIFRRIGYHWVTAPAPHYHLALAPEGTEVGSMFFREALLDGRPFLSGPEATLWIMGDSMVQELSPQTSGHAAGIASHLGARLGCATYGLGRPGATDIRKAFFLHTSLSNHPPKLVLWIHDNLPWRPFNLDPTTFRLNEQRLEGEVTVSKIPEIPDPATSPYPDAIVAMEASITLPRGESQPIRLYTWAIRDRKRALSPDLKTHETMSMDLLPWIQAVKAEPRLAHVMILDETDFDANRPILWWNPPAATPGR